MMNPALDQALVAAIVGLALGFFIVRFFRRRSAGKGSCDAGCGCGTKSSRGGLSKEADAASNGK